MIVADVSPEKLVQEMALGAHQAVHTTEDSALEWYGSDAWGRGHRA
jgi:hypothetical protein